MPTAARRATGSSALRGNSHGPHPPVAVTGPYRFYDWDILGRVLIRMYDYSLAPATHVLAQYVFRMGAVLYGGNFAVRRDALEAIGGFDTSIEFHGEDTNLARRISKAGRVRLRQPVLGLHVGAPLQDDGARKGVRALRQEFLRRDLPASSVRHHPRRRSRLNRCLDTSPTCSAISMYTRRGAMDG